MHEPPVFDHDNIGAAEVRRLRTLKGWTVNKAAAFVGCDPSTWARWEHGIQLPSSSFRRTIAEMLGRHR